MRDLHLAGLLPPGCIVGFAGADRLHTAARPTPHAAARPKKKMRDQMWGAKNLSGKFTSQINQLNDARGGGSVTNTELSPFLAGTILIAGTFPLR